MSPPLMESCCRGNFFAILSWESLKYLKIIQYWVLRKRQDAKVLQGEVTIIQYSRLLFGFEVLLFVFEGPLLAVRFVISLFNNC
jgi:hypothetical protein